MIDLGGPLWEEWRAASDDGSVILPRGAPRKGFVDEVVSCLQFQSGLDAVGEDDAPAPAVAPANAVVGAPKEELLGEAVQAWL